jgi:hypothetical protein
LLRRQRRRLRSGMDLHCNYLPSTSSGFTPFLLRPPSRAFLPPHPACSSPGHLASHMHSSPVVLPLLLRFAPPRPTHILRGFATVRCLLPGTVNGQREMKLVNRYLWVGTGAWEQTPNLFFFHLLK